MSSGDKLTAMGAARRAILWGAALRHAASAHDCRRQARIWQIACPEQAASVDMKADEWERAMMADLNKLENVHALPAAIDIMLRNKDLVKKVLAAGELDGKPLRGLDVVSLELVVAHIRSALVDLVLLEQKAMQ